MPQIETLKKLAEIQQKLKAPKNQHNKFGGYNYRSCEDILEAVKPLLDGASILLTDTLEQIGDRYYVKATATFFHGDSHISTIAYAREEETKKGMDASQITGSTSSYARKYALNGLLCVDDVKDADHPSQTQAETFIAEKDIKAINKIIKDKNIDTAKFLKYMGVDKVESIDTKSLSKAMNALNNAKARPKTIKCPEQKKEINASECSSCSMLQGCPAHEVKNDN